MIKLTPVLSTKKITMSHNASLIQRDLNHIWHPATRMKDLSHFPPLIIHKAEGSYLYTDRGKIIDGISSWWCKSLGHGHPQILEAIRQQLQAFEHVIAANTTHPSLIELGEKLAEISKKQQVYFASDGSSAVEIALKLALHAYQIKGEHHKNEFISLRNSYHGETLGTLSVSDLGLYKKPYEGYGLTCHFIETIPYVSSIHDPLWLDADYHWQKVFLQLEKIKTNVCALILEPIIQGSGGMLCYSGDFLKKLRAWTQKNGIYFIADEIMTGIGRTGQWLACDLVEVEADLICFSKGLTSGTLPLSVVLVDKEIYQLFYNLQQGENAFLHSHTFSGHALAVSAALATIKVIEKEGILQQARTLGNLMHSKFLDIAEQTKKITHVRSMGAMVAGDLIPLENQHAGRLVQQRALEAGALLRPLGNTLYWLPPLNTKPELIDQLAEITLHSINTIYGNHYS